MRKIKRLLAVIGIGALAMTMTVAANAQADPSPSLGLGNISPDARGSLTIHKFSGMPDGASGSGAVVDPLPDGVEPLDGVTFNVCKVDGFDLTDPLDWPLISELNQNVVDTGQLPEGITCATPTSQVTGEGDNAKGQALFSDLDLGVYFVTESDSPVQVVERVAPFIVTIPTAHESTNTWLYDVHVYPKNAVAGISKNIVDAGFVGIGSPVTWGVETVVPSLQYNFDNFVITDVLDSRLDYVGDSMKVYVSDYPIEFDGEGDPFYTDSDGTVTSVEEFEDYTLAVDGQELRLEFGDATDPTVNSGQYIYFTFDTIVNSLGTTTVDSNDNVTSIAGLISNTAVLWVNDWSQEGEGVPSNEVTSQWGALRIFKHSGSLDPESVLALSDAVFQIFASDADANACIQAVADGNDCEKAIVADGKDKFVTDAKGEVFIPGLNVGVNDDTDRTYHVVEIVAPAGYSLSNTVYSVAVKASGVDADGNYVDYANLNIHNDKIPGGTMPKTGAEGTMWLMIVSGTLALGGVGFLVASRKRTAKVTA